VCLVAIVVVPVELLAVVCLFPGLLFFYMFLLQHRLTHAHTCAQT